MPTMKHRCLVLLLFWIQQAHLASIQVSTSGNDEDCGVGSACRTIARAISLAPPNGTVILRPGRYSGDGNCGVTIQKPLTLESSGGSTRTIVDCMQRSRGFTLLSDVVFRGVTIQDGLVGALKTCDQEPGQKTASTPLAPRQFQDHHNASMVGGDLHITATRASEESAGGCVLVMGCTAVLRDCHLVRCSAPFGGGVAAISANVRLRNVTLSNNRAQHGGGLYTSSAHLLLANATILNNTVFNCGPVLELNQGNAALGAGVAIFGTVAEFLFVTMTENQARASGGCAVPMTGCPWASGGGIFAGDSKISITSSDIARSVLRANHGGVMGGGLALSNSVAGLLLTKIVNNTLALIMTPKCSPPFCGLNGGAFAMKNSSVSALDSQFSGNVLVGDKAFGAGVAVFSARNLSLGRCSILHNAMDVTQNGFGGGVYVAESRDVVVFGSQMSSNIITAQAIEGTPSKFNGNGAGMMVTKTHLALLDCGINFNSVEAVGAEFQYHDSFVQANGVGLYVNLASVMGTSTEIAQNSVLGAYYGTGGGVGARFSSLQLHNCHVSGNSITNATQGRGAGVAVHSNSQLWLQESSVSSNLQQFTQFGLGAGLYVASGSRAMLSSCRLIMNVGLSNWTNQTEFRHGNNGGGVYSYRGELNISSSVISGNLLQGVEGYGAGVYECCSSTLHLLNTTIEKNSVIGTLVAGGGFYGAGDSEVLITNADIRENSAIGSTSGQGAGVFGIGITGRLGLNRCSIVGNRIGRGTLSTKAESEQQIGGGGLSLTGSRFDATDTVIAHNVVPASDGIGGGVLIFGSNDTFVQFSSSSIAFNSAASGGGLYLGSDQIFFTACLVANNAATSQGGGVFVAADASLYFDGTATENYAKLGGTIFSTQVADRSDRFLVQGTIVGTEGVAITLPVLEESAVNVTKLEFACGAGTYPIIIDDVARRVFSSTSSSRFPPFVTQQIYSQTVTSLNYRCFPCDSGTYQLLPLSKSNSSVNGRCHSCPFGGSCVGGRNLLQAAQGFWPLRNEDSEVSFTRCPPGYCCSNSSCSLGETCLGGRVGTLCGDCPGGTGAAFFTTRCVPDSACDDAAWAIPLLLGVTVFYTVFLVAPFDRPTGLLSIMLFFYQTLSLVRAQSEWDEVKSEFVSKFLGSVESVVLGAAPSSTSPDSKGICVIPGSSSVAHVAAGYLSPGFVGLFMFVWWVLAKLRDRFKSSVDSEPGLLTTSSAKDIKASAWQRLSTAARSSWRKARGSTFMKKFRPGLAAAVRLVNLSYSNLAATSFQLVSCTNLSGTNRFVLALQGSIECPQGWQIVPLLVLIGLTLLPIGLTVWGQKNKNTHPAVVASMQGIFAPGRRHWMAVMLYQRWVLTVIRTLVPSSLWGGLLIVLTCVVYLQMALWFRPLRCRHMQEFYAWSMLALSTVALISFAYSVRQSLATTQDFDANSRTMTALAWIQYLVALAPGVAAFSWTIAPLVRHKYRQLTNKLGIKRRDSGEGLSPGDGISLVELVS